MSKPVAVVGLCAVACILGAAGAVWLLRHREAPPDPPAVVEKIREVARLETVELTLYKKISFEPDPEEGSSLWGDLANWVRYSVRKPRGRAIVFAKVQVGLDLQQLDSTRLRLHGTRAEVILPPLDAQVQLLPAETEIIGSNLDSAETAQLFERARAAFEREVMADPRLRQKAREASERAIRALLITLGYREVLFVEQPFRAAQSG